ncbi:MAG: hypothetical protein KDK36_00850, partial [Leptospiraceae bacterium]|nr:hypothetical protein [Leptospiraceae bacterium]
SLYENYKFSESIKIYKSILEKLSKREKTKVFQEYSKKITKKIDVTQETGTSFITNRVKSYCELAEKKNFQLRLARDRGKTLDIIEKEESIQESLINARRTLEYSEFSNQELMDYYNSTVQRINSDKRTSLAKLLRKGDLKYKKEEITKWDAFNRSLLFPGFGQISEKPEKFKSSVIFFTAIPLATIGALSYINYYNQQKKYNSMTGTPFLMSAFFPDYAPVFIASDMNTFNSQRKKVDSSYSLMSASLGIYSLFYIYSLIDVLYFTDRTEVLGSLDPNNLHLVKLDKGGFNVSLNRIPADSTNSIFPSLENKYSIFYSYSW